MPMPTNLFEEFKSGIGSNIAPALFQPKVFAQLQYEFIAASKMYANYASTNPLSPIVMMDPQIHKNGEGTTQWIVPRVRALDYTTGIRNHESRLNQQERLSFDNFILNSEILSKSIEDVLYNMLQKAVPFDTDNPKYKLLRTWLAQNLEYETLARMTTWLYPNLTTGLSNIAGNVPSFDRALTPLPITRAQWHTNQTLGVLFNSFETPANTGPSNTGLDFDIVLAAKTMSQDGGSEYGIEAAISPTALNIYNDLPDDENIMWIDPGCTQSLLSDPKVKDGALNRGVIVDMKYQPNILRKGGYVMKLGSTHIIEMPFLKRFRQKSADGNKIIAWCLFLGGGAFASGWDHETVIGQKIDEELLIKRTFLHDPRALGTMMYDSTYAKKPGAIAGTPAKVENGIIHVFVSVNK